MTTTKPTTPIEDHGSELLARLNRTAEDAVFLVHQTRTRWELQGPTRVEVDSSVRKVATCRTKIARAREELAKARKKQDELDKPPSSPTKSPAKTEKAQEKEKERVEKKKAAQAAQAEVCKKRLEDISAAEKALEKREKEEKRTADCAANAPALLEAVHVEAMKQLQSRKWVTTTDAQGGSDKAPNASEAPPAADEGEEKATTGTSRFGFVKVVEQLLRRGLEAQGITDEVQIAKTLEASKKHDRVVYAWEYRAPKSEWSRVYVGQSKGQSGWFGRTKQHISSSADPGTSDFYTRLSARIRSTQSSCWRVLLLEALGPVREKTEELDLLELDVAEAKHIVLSETLHPKGLNSEVIFHTADVLPFLKQAFQSQPPASSAKAQSPRK